jgi:hypothetical protein
MKGGSSIRMLTFFLDRASRDVVAWIDLCNVLIFFSLVFLVNNLTSRYWDKENQSIKAHV